MIRYTRASTIPREQLETFFLENWGDSVMAIRGQLIPLSACDGFMAYQSEQILGLITFHTSPDYQEIISLDSLVENQGIGSQLLAQVEAEALNNGIQDIRLITTNDNLRALAFYQKRGYQLHQLYPNAVAKARQLKPGIPLIASNGIPIRDEIELRKGLSHDNNA